jgi:signal transduction histidine kinase
MSARLCEKQPSQRLLRVYGIRVPDPSAAERVLAVLEQTGAQVDRAQLDRLSDHVLAMSALDLQSPVPATDGPTTDLASALELLRCTLLESVVSSSNVRSLLDALPVLVVVCDQAGRVLEGNRDTLHALGLDLGDAVSDRLGIALCDAETHECRSGPRTYLLSVACLRSAYDDVDGWVVVGADISAQVRVREELDLARQLAQRHADARASFLANTSHEIRTPLHGIVGASELLASTPLADDQRDLLGVILDSGRHLSSLIDAVIDLTRIDAGSIELERVPVSPSRLARQVVASVDAAARDKHLRLRLELGRQAARPVLGDPLRLRQILINLVSNALKFTPEGGDVRLVVAPIAEEDGVELRFEIHDTGVGIARARCEHIFEVFEQAEPSTTRRYGGSGLGLPIARRLARMMGGDITVRSTLGSGSTFVATMRLPAAEGVPVAELSGVGSLREGLSVLVVDDHPINLLVARRMLERLGVVTTTVASGREALALDPDSVDLVLMDCQMPDLDGFETTRRWRAAETRGRLPILALTAAVDERTRHLALDSGMDEVLTKPLNLDGLHAALFRWTQEFA